MKKQEVVYCPHCTNVVWVENHRGEAAEHECRECGTIFECSMIHFNTPTRGKNQKLPVAKKDVE